LSIWDNGIGTAEIVEGVGLAGMRERISEFNGRFKAAGLADGFELSVFIPRRTDREKK
jgi:signal transduction histidine kinase